MAGSTPYSDAVAKAKADMAARGQLVPDPGAADTTTVDNDEFAEVVADATLGVDGEGDQPGAPPNQQKPKTETKVGGDTVPTETRKFAKVESIDKKHGLVFGWGIICKEGGVDYFDVQDDHIPEDSMLEAAADFAKGARPGKDMHAGDHTGQHIFMFPLTTDIAKALGITTDKTGLLLGYMPPPDMLKKFEDGTYTGFSIGGQRIHDEEVS